MSEITNEKVEEITEKLQYIGLDLNNIPDFLINTDTMDFRPERTYSDKTFKVYKYIPINDIQIVITKANKDDSIQDKYNNASLIKKYLIPETEEDMLKYADFIKMLKNTDIYDIEDIAKEQEKMSISEPFKVKYNKDYLWEIYYSQYTNKYFMLVCTENTNYSTLFYTLREKIKNRDVNKMIYVPISYMDYSRELLGKDDFKDLEKYIWQFTKEWPMIYEVYDKNGNKSIQICGKTIVYEKLESIYKIVLNSRDNAVKFFKLIKALFILKTEFPHDYNFEVQISSEGGIEFIYNTKIVNYENIANFVRDEYRKKSETLRIIKKEEKILKEVLNNLKKIEEEQEKEYLLKQNQVATYMKCKKTFFGRVRYFFKGKIKEESEKTTVTESKIELDEEDKQQIYEKDFYTIEDLTNICKELNDILTNVKNIRMDKRALEIKNNQLKVKIKNATQFIKDIENHKKNIFEFWRFANKDNQLVLETGSIERPEEEEKVESKEEYFDYIDDIEEIGIKIDKKQREILTKEETDTVYLVKARILDLVNAIRRKNQYNFTSDLENIKNDLRSIQLLFGAENYDIFGNSIGDKTRIDTLGSKKHREKRKDEYRILDINEETDIESFLFKLQERIKILDNIFNKNSLGIRLKIYLASNEPINIKGYGIFKINPENALNKIGDENVVGLYSIHLYPNSPAVALSNIIYYDNFNKTLPIGMDIEDEVLLDLEKINIELKRQKLFRMNIKIDDFNIKTRTICAYEYEVKGNI